MKTIIYHIIFWTTLLCVGCNQEEDIVPTEGNEMEFILPQGNHDYDSEMVAFYEQYGVLPVYLFEKKDLYWNNTVQEDVVGLAGDPEYVGEVWDFSRHIFFDVYPDSLLRDYLPLKFFICSSLQEITKTGDGDKGTEVYARQGYDYFAVNYAGESFTSLSDRSKMDYSAVLNSLFLLRLPLEVPQEFVDLTDYSGGETHQSNNTYLLERGIISNQVITYANRKDKNNRIQEDFKDYLYLVSTPKEILLSQPKTLSSTDWYKEHIPFEGALIRPEDKNGLIQKKYDIVCEYLREEVGIDMEVLQAPLDGLINK